MRQAISSGHAVRPAELHRMLFDLILLGNDNEICNCANTRVLAVAIRRSIYQREPPPWAIYSMCVCARKIPRNK